MSFIGRFQQKPFDVFKFASDLGLGTGWGKMTPQFTGDTLDVKIENCCFCEGIQMNQPVCFESAGIMTATLSGIAREEITVKESDCMAKGDSFCNFKVNVPEGLRHHLRSSE